MDINMDHMGGLFHGVLAGLEGSVDAIAVIEQGRIRTILRHESDQSYDSTAPSQTFMVTDLMSNISYVVSQFGSRAQLLVSVKDRLIVAEMGSSADFPEIAEILTRRMGN